jgi:hypothetical protein
LPATASTFAGYGIVLQNVSPDEDALRVTVLVNIVDAGGRMLKSESDTYEAIPAGATYSAGGESIFGGTPARLEITTTVGQRQKRSPSLVLPPVSNLRVTSDFLGANAVGEVANPSTTKSLSGLARITFVCLDASGNVIGGGFTYPASAVPTGWSSWVRDVDRGPVGIPDLLADALLLRVERRFTDGILKPGGKTDGSVRAVPLRKVVLDALDAMPARIDTPVLFPAPAAATSTSRSSGIASGLRPCA